MTKSVWQGCDIYASSFAFQVHDELVLEADPSVLKEAGLLLRMSMETAASLLGMNCRILHNVICFCSLVLLKSVISLLVCCNLLASLFLWNFLIVVLFTLLLSFSFLFVTNRIYTLYIYMLFTILNFKLIKICLPRIFSSFACQTQGWKNVGITGTFRGRVIYGQSYFANNS